MVLSDDFRASTVAVCDGCLGSVMACMRDSKLAALTPPRPPKRGGRVFTPPLEEEGSGGPSLPSPTGNQASESNARLLSRVASQQKVHCCSTVVTLLLHWCNTGVTLLLHCRCTVITLLLHCCYNSITLSLLCCYSVVTLLLPPYRSSDRAVLG
jgi:hypothetical protein